MSDIKNNKAFTMVEMLISLIVAAIMILTIGVLSSVGTTTYAGLTKESQIYNDIAYGYKLMQNKARSAQGVAVKSQAGLWVGQYLEVGEQAFGVYPGTDSLDFVYIEEFANPSEREIIFSVPNPSPDLSIVFSNITTRSFTVNLTGTKDDIPFTFTTNILRRSK